MTTQEELLPEAYHVDMEEMHLQVLSDPKLKEKMQEIVDWIQIEYNVEV